MFPLVTIHSFQSYLSNSSPAWWEATIAYDNLGYVVGVTQSNGATDTYEWDGYGKLYRHSKSVNGSQQAVTRYAFSAIGLLTVLENPDGQTIYRDPDTFGRLMREVLPDGRKITYEYDLADRLQTRTLHAGVIAKLITTYSYDSTYARLTKVVENLPGATSGGRIVDVFYNGTRLVSQVKDQNNRKRSFYYDGFGQVVRVTDDLIAQGSGNATTLGLDPMGLVISRVVTEQEEQGNGSYAAKTFRLEFVRDAWGRVTHKKNFGDITAGVPSSPLTIQQSSWDSLGNLVEIIGAPSQTSGSDTRKSSFEHDAIGRVLKSTLSPRVGSSSSPIVLENIFDDTPSGAGLVITRKDGRGNASIYSYDLGGRLIERKLPGAASGSRTWLYSWFPSGRLDKWIDGNGAEVKIGYDSLLRPEKRWLSVMGSTTLSAMCTNEVFGYDDLSRPNLASTYMTQFGTTSGPSGSANLLVKAQSLTDAFGRQKWESFGLWDNGSHSPAATMTFTSGWGATGAEDYSFRRSLSTPNQFLLNFTPDSIGRMSKTQLSGNGLTAFDMLEYKYVGQRPVQRLSRHVSGADRTTTDYGYDNLGQLASTTSRYGAGNANDPVLFTQTLVRNLQGYVLEEHFSKSDGSVGDRHSLDGFDRLVTAELGVNNFGQTPTVAKKVDYALDDASNRTSVTETFGSSILTSTYGVASDRNEYTSVSGTGYSYDSNGNLISDGYYFYVYDYLNRLSEVYVITYPEGIGTSSRTALVYDHETQKKRRGPPTKLSTKRARDLLDRIRPRVVKDLKQTKSSSKTRQSAYAVSSSVNQNLTSTLNEPVLEFVAWYGYDPMNRRVWKASLYESSFYVYDGWRLAEEYDGGLNPTVSYFDGIGVDEHAGFARKVAGSWLHYAIDQDHKGSVTRVLDSGGQVIANFEYDPYGNRNLVQGAPGFNIAYGYIGRYHDIETELIYVRNRYYSPSLGRFLTLDPSGLWLDGPNLGNGYAYGWSNPTSVVDQNGNFGWFALAGAVLGAIAGFQEGGIAGAIVGAVVGAVVGGTVGVGIDSAVSTVIAGYRALAAGYGIVEGAQLAYIAGGTTMLGGLGLIGSKGTHITQFGRQRRIRLPKFKPRRQYCRMKGNTSATKPPEKVIKNADKPLEPASHRITPGSTSAAKGGVKLVTVSRWGRPGLQSGDWVMKGGANRWNYLRSGKWDPFPWNQRAPFKVGEVFQVSESSVLLPQSEGALGRLKGLLLGQRQYFPK